MRWLRDVEREERELGKWRQDFSTMGLKSDRAGEGVGSIGGTPPIEHPLLFCPI